MPVPNRYKTIYYGLKRNSPHNVALIHPLMFMMRRILFAVCIVFLDEVEVLSSVIFMYMTLTMLAYVLTEQQWQYGVINNQHIFNEIVLYILSLLMLCFTNWLSPLVRYSIGFVMITVVLIFVIYNIIIMLLFACKLMILNVRR